MNAGSECEHQQENASRKHFAQYEKVVTTVNRGQTKKIVYIFRKMESKSAKDSRSQNNNNTKPRSRICTAQPALPPSHCQPSGRVFPLCHL
ncbi:MAG: hypothetical protein CL912_08940 [Deltaproteobacteria bacterium]|nr:hypothetical protein [Deltaproteobacteria bacterium]